MSIWHSLTSLFSKAPTALDQANGIVSKVLGLIHDAEARFPTGTEKLEHVRAELSKIWGDFTAIAATFEAAWPTIASLVATLVSLYNASGAFKHKTA